MTQGTGDRVSLVGTACWAPTVMMYLLPDGDVRACCRSARLGNIRTERLPDIWHGERRKRLELALAAHDYSLGCQSCGAEVALEGRSGSFPEVYDERAEGLSGLQGDPEWPRWMEFNLSNLCNLQCGMCNGELSSSIRLHREHRAPLAPAYGEQFFADLPPFLTHLHEAQFAGGEPFMAPENYRVWELVEEVAPDLSCHVVTNATQWNSRVRAALERFPLGFTFSIDSVRPDTYAAIRVGADLGEVLTNVERYMEAAARFGTDCSINFCWMPQNALELPEILRFGDQLGLRVQVQVVREPATHSIPELPVTDVVRIHRELDRIADRVSGGLTLNRPVWEEELERLRSWTRGSETLVTIRGASRATVLQFDCWGSPGAASTPIDFDRLIGASRDGLVHSMVVDTNDVVVEASSDLEDLLVGPDATMVGRSIKDLSPLSEGIFGPVRGMDVLADTDEHWESVVSYDSVAVHLVSRPRRDARGWADRADFYMVFCEPVAADGDIGRSMDAI